MNETTKQALPNSEPLYRRSASAWVGWQPDAYPPVPLHVRPFRIVWDTTALWPLLEPTQRSPLATAIQWAENRWRQRIVGWPKETCDIHSLRIKLVPHLEPQLGRAAATTRVIALEPEPIGESSQEVLTSPSRGGAAFLPGAATIEIDVKDIPRLMGSTTGTVASADLSPIAPSAAECPTGGLLSALKSDFMAWRRDEISNVSCSCLGDMVAHEVGHALGFGTIWEARHCIEGHYDNPVFVGANAMRAYRILRANWLGTPDEVEKLELVGVPIENTGDAGDRWVHWRHTAFSAGGAPFRELMTTNVYVKRQISILTVASLKDLGYHIASEGKSVSGESFWLPDDFDKCHAADLELIGKRS